MPKKIAIIGSGFSSLSAACNLAAAGYDVTIYEKNSQIGGRASQYIKDGFIIDKGPTWYWMPDVFDKFFSDLGKRQEDYYTIDKLSPAYKVYFSPSDVISIADNMQSIVDLFESIEKGSGKKLFNFLQKAKANYDIAIKDLVYKPGKSPTELITWQTIKRLPLFIRTIKDDVSKLVNDPRLRQILEFPVLFLGAKADNTPAFYNFMNYADFGLGTWHPRGGMYAVVQGIEKMARELGVKIITNAAVSKINIEQSIVKSININNTNIDVDIVVSGADYHHTDSLLDRTYRMYSDAYWSKKIFSPSALQFYVAFDKKLSNIDHHLLFFDVPFKQHAEEIYDKAQWPNNPLFYASFPTYTDISLAPHDKEIGIFLIPIASGLEDSDILREKYFNIIINRFEKLTNQEIRSSILFHKSYCINDFKSEYNSYKGNAYGLANTLLQTAFLRPKLQSSKVNNLYYTGQLTVPGPGVPPALISGKIVSDLIKNNN